MIRKKDILEIKNEIDKVPIAVTLDNKPILSFTYEVN